MPQFMLPAPPSAHAYTFLCLRLCLNIFLKKVPLLGSYHVAQPDILQVQRRGQWLVGAA
jgi:hypothetical protein